MQDIDDCSTVTKRVDLVTERASTAFETEQVWQGFPLVFGEGISHGAPFRNRDDESVVDAGQAEVAFNRIATHRSLFLDADTEAWQVDLEGSVAQRSAHLQKAGYSNLAADPSCSRRHLTLLVAEWDDHAIQATLSYLSCTASHNPVIFRFGKEEHPGDLEAYLDPAYSN